METTTVHVIGKCPVKGCKTRKRHSFPGRVENTRYGKRTSWGMPTAQGAAFPVPTWGPAIPSRTAARDQWFTDAMAAHGWVCEEHDKFCKIAVVKGVVNEQKTCNAKCEAATGPNCECSCGGELHGSAHA